MITGSASCWPITVVDRSRSFVQPDHVRREAELGERVDVVSSVMPASEPATSAL